MQTTATPPDITSTEISDLGKVSLATLATTAEDPDVTSLIKRIAPSLPDIRRVQSFFGSTYGSVS